MESSRLQNCSYSSLQTFRIRQDGIVLQIVGLSFLPQRPAQLTSRSYTLKGITKVTSTRDTVKSHNSLATLQWRSKWSIVSPSDLHMLRQSGILIPLFRKLSARIFPFIAAHAKNPTWGRDLASYTVCQGKLLRFIPSTSQDFIISTYFEVLNLRNSFDHPILLRLG